MNRKKYMILILSGILALSSCSDWLEVNPQTTIKENVLFGREDGFKSALTGVYINMSGEALYGRNMSYYLPELLARTWFFVPSDMEQIARFSDYKYKPADAQLNDDDEKLLHKIWIGYYLSIAQLNSILANLESTKANFGPGTADIIKGEALGLRAFLHLDVLRLFAKVPEDANLSEKAIPYITDLTRKIDKLLSADMETVLKAIEKDLDDAQELLSKADPILTGGNNDGQGDGWLSFRESRFNYYAVLATKARFYLWCGNKEKAQLYAKQVIDSRQFKLADNNSYKVGDGNLIFQQENIFNVVNPDHHLLVYADFTNERHRLKLTEAVFDLAYEKDNNPDDIRAVRRRYWTNSPDDGYISYLKYTGSTEAQLKIANTIPLIRLSEMYLILMELNALPDAALLFREYRISRMLNSTLENDFGDEASRKDRVEKEFRKEFFAEGQLFFFYKRNKYEKFSWPSAFSIPDMSLYVLPKPHKQSQYE